MKNGGNHPWTRKADEPGAAYTLFTEYQLMGDKRTVSAVAKNHHLKTKTGLQKLADQWGWAHRADQWDAYLAQKKVTEEGKSVILQAHEEARAVGYLARAARIAAKELLIELKDKKLKKQKLGLSAGQVVLLVSESTKLARLVRGEATEVTAVTGARERLADKIERMAEAFRRADARKDMPNT